MTATIYAPQPISRVACPLMLTLEVIEPPEAVESGFSAMELAWFEHGDRAPQSAARGHVASTAPQMSSAHRVH